METTLTLKTIRNEGRLDVADLARQLMAISERLIETQGWVPLTAAVVTMERLHLFGGSFPKEAQWAGWLEVLSATAGQMNAEAVLLNSQCHFRRVSIGRIQTGGYFSQDASALEVVTEYNLAMCKTGLLPGWRRAIATLCLSPYCPSKLFLREFELTPKGPQFELATEHSGQALSILKPWWTPPQKENQCIGKPN